jgi:hypothetical protein
VSGGAQRVSASAAASPARDRSDRQPLSRGERFYREKIIRHPLSSKSSATTIKRQPHPQHEVCMFIAAKLSYGSGGWSTRGLCYLRGDATERHDFARSPPGEYSEALRRVGHRVMCRQSMTGRVPHFLADWVRSLG